MRDRQGASNRGVSHFRGPSSSYRWVSPEPLRLAGGPKGTFAVSTARRCGQRPRRHGDRCTKSRSATIQSHKGELMTWNVLAKSGELSRSFGRRWLAGSASPACVWLYGLAGPPSAPQPRSRGAPVTGLWLRRNSVIAALVVSRLASWRSGDLLRFRATLSKGAQVRLRLVPASTSGPDGRRRRSHLPRRRPHPGSPTPPPGGERGGDLEPSPTVTTERFKPREVSQISWKGSVAHQVGLDIDSRPPPRRENGEGSGGLEALLILTRSCARKLPTRASR